MPSKKHQSPPELFYAVLADRDVLYFTVDEDGRVIDCNAHTLKLWRQKRLEDVVGQPARKYEVESFRAFNFPNTSNFDYRDHVRAYPYRNRTVAYLTTEFLSEGEDGKPVRTVVGSQAKQLIKDSSKSYQTLDLIFRIAPIFLYCSDAKGLILDCNQQFLDQLGLEREECIGFHIEDIMNHQQWVNAYQCMSTRQVAKFEESFTPEDTDKENLTFLSVKSPLLDTNEELTGMINVSVDISNQKEMERTLQAEKIFTEEASRSKSQFILNMKNDLKTPVLGIQALTETIMGIGGEQESYATLDMIADTCRQLMEICNQIADFANSQDNLVPITNKPFDLTSITSYLTDIYKHRARAKKIDFFTKVDEGCPRYVIGDEYRLRRILANLLSNAIKFTEEGEVSLHVQALPSRDQRSVTLRFAIIDTGIGITAENQKRIFDEFARLTPSHKGTYEGRGLGLTIVQRFVHDLDGTISISSSTNAGSQFVADIKFMVPHTSIRSIPQLPF